MSVFQVAEVSGLVNKIERTDRDDVRISVYSQPSYFSKKKDEWVKKGDAFYLSVTINERHDAYLAVKRLLEDGLIDKDGKPKSPLKVAIGGLSEEGTTGVDLSYTKKEVGDKVYVNFYLNLAPWGKVVFGSNSIRDSAPATKPEKASDKDSPFG